MSLGLLSDVNWLAVLVAAVAYFVLGALWYSPPPMAKLWQSAGGIDVPEGERVSPLPFLGSFVAYLVAATVTAMLALATESDTIDEGCKLGLLVGIGYALTAAAVQSLYERKPRPLAWFLFNGIYNVIALTIVGIIVSAWR